MSVAVCRADGAPAHVRPCPMGVAVGDGEWNTPLMVDIELCSSRTLGTILFDGMRRRRMRAERWGEIDDGGVLMWCGR